MRWLGSENKTSSKSNQIILKEFVHTKYSVLYDNTIGQNVIVEAHKWRTFLQDHNVDDCGHVGFVILEQKYETDGSVVEETMYRLESLLYFLYLTLFSILNIW